MDREQSAQKCVLKRRNNWGNKSSRYKKALNNQGFFDEYGGEEVRHIKVHLILMTSESLMLYGAYRVKFVHCDPSFPLQSHPMWGNKWGNRS